MLVCWFLCLTGCVDNSMRFGPTENQNDKLEILDIQFEEGYKKFHVDVKIKDGYAPEKVNRIQDLKVVSKELRIDMKEVIDEVQPQFIGSKNIKAEKIAELGFKMLILVDLTLNEQQVLEQRIIVENLRSLFSNDNLFVAFMKDGGVTESYPVTDYVLANYFVESNSSKKLYRSILSKMDELEGKKSAYFPKLKQDGIWKNIPADRKQLLVFSDGQVYKDNKPIDTEHFELQRKLLDRGAGTIGFPIYYVNVPCLDEEVEIENEAENLITYLCEQTGGTYYSKVAGIGLAKNILEGQQVGNVDFRFSFVNPDYKVYRGIKRCLKIDCIAGDSLLLTGHKFYSLGSIYHPIIVNGTSSWRIFVQGTLVFICLLLLIYVVFQYIVPRIQYEIFKRKYIINYQGKNTSLNNIQVDESCYFCKAPFEKGDQVVVKCEHVMHQSCWEENEYKCPEYGRKCKDGSHYYNRHKLYDKRNAPYYMNWLLAGTCAGAFSWFFFIQNAFHFGYEWVINLLFDVTEIDPNSETAKDLLDKFGNELFYAPYFGLYVCFFLTLFLSMLSSHGNWWWKRLAFVFGKAVVTAICGYITFFFTAIVALAMGIGGDFLLLDWIPWTLNGFLIAFAVSYKTDIKLKKALVGAAISIVFGLGSMYIWKYSQNAQIDTRDLMLISNLIYCVGLAISLAVNFPQSERYFLRMEGPVKTMEIAIYKWMNAQVINRRVTIGKSVDCNLQMSWDVNGNIAPVQAEILSKRGNIYLVALESGVYMKDKPVKLETPKRLYHGDSFRIGQTLFTYVEHDV